MGLISVNGWEPAHLSFSTVDGYRMCGKKVELSKVLRLEQRPGLAGIGGNAVHTASEAVDKLIYEEGWDALDPEPVEDTPAPF